MFKCLAFALTIVVLGLTHSATGRADEGVQVGVDADPQGNSATSLGPIQNCRTVKANEEFLIDVFVTNVEALTAFEVTLQFDPAVLQVRAVTDAMLLAAKQGSNVISVFSDTPPGPNPGSFVVAAADFGALGQTEESGSGVLARLTIRALSKGTSSLIISKPKLAKTVGNDSSVPIGPTDSGGQTFAGPVFNANVAVDTDCSPPSPGPSASPTPDRSASPGSSPTGPSLSATKTPSPITSTARQTTAPGAASDGSGGGMSAGAWLGIGIGAAAVALAAVAGIWWATHRRRVSS